MSVSPAHSGFASVGRAAPATGQTMMHPNSIHREILEALAEQPDGLDPPPAVIQSAVDHLIRLGFVEAVAGAGGSERLKITSAGHTALHTSAMH